MGFLNVLVKANTARFADITLLFRGIGLMLLALPAHSSRPLLAVRVHASARKISPIPRKSSSVSANRAVFASTGTR